MAVGSRAARAATANASASGAPVPSSALSASSSKEGFVRQQALGEPGELPDVLRGFGAGPPLIRKSPR